MTATKIRMKAGCGYSQNLLEIDSIYLEGCTEPGLYKKETVHDYVKSHPNSIKVNIYPYPVLVPATSVSGEKYVRSAPNNTQSDNLLKLPRI